MRAPMPSTSMRTSAPLSSFCAFFAAFVVLGARRAARRDPRVWARTATAGRPAAPWRKGAWPGGSRGRRRRCRRRGRSGGTTGTTGSRRLGSKLGARSRYCGSVSTCSAPVATSHSFSEIGLSGEGARVREPPPVRRPGRIGQVAALAAIDQRGPALVEVDDEQLAPVRDHRGLPGGAATARPSPPARGRDPPGGGRRRRSAARTSMVSSPPSSLTVTTEAPSCVQRECL